MIENNDDLISRSALKEKLNKKAFDLANGGMLFIETINQIIDNAPTVERPQCEKCLKDQLSSIYGVQHDNEHI